jgi:single-strand DNA-binding protein
VTRVIPPDDAGSRSAQPADREGDRTVNKVLLTGRLTRDPEMRSLASGKNVTTFTVASNEFIGGGKEKAEYHPVVAWDRLAEIAGRYLGKGQQVAIEGRLQTRSWDDEKGARHWKTEIVASHVEMLSGRKKKDYEAQQAADSLVAQAVALGESAASEPIAEPSFDPGMSDEDDDANELEEETATGVAA